MASLPTEPSGPGRALLADLRRADVGEPVDLGLDPEPGELVTVGAAHRRPCVLLVHVAHERDQARTLRVHLAADRHPLVHERRERHVPALADVAEPLAVGDAHVGEVHLVELGLAGRLHERPHFDARRVHVDDEHREALVLRLLGVGAHDDDAEARDVRERRPHLLAVDDPLVTVAHRARREARDVGARARLAEHLAPDLFAREQRAQVAALLLVAAVRDDRRRAHAVADRVAAVRKRRARLRSSSRSRRSGASATHRGRRSPRGSAPTRGPASYCAPSTSAGFVVFGSCSARSSSQRSITRCSSVGHAVLLVVAPGLDRSVKPTERTAIAARPDPWPTQQPCDRVRAAAISLIAAALARRGGVRLSPPDAGAATGPVTATSIAARNARLAAIGARSGASYAVHRARLATAGRGAARRARGRVPAAHRHAGRRRARQA